MNSKMAVFAAALVSKCWKAHSPFNVAWKLGTGSLIGTLSHLAQYHRQIAQKIGLTPLSRPPRKTQIRGSGIVMGEARLDVAFPIFWNRSSMIARRSRHWFRGLAPSGSRSASTVGPVTSHA